MARPDTVTVYQDQPGHWRWHRRAGNGRNVSSSGEAFSSKTAAVRSARRANLATVQVVLRVDE